MDTHQLDRQPVTQEELNYRGFAARVSFIIQGSSLPSPEGCLKPNRLAALGRRGVYATPMEIEHLKSDCPLECGKYVRNLRETRGFAPLPEEEPRE